MTSESILDMAVGSTVEIRYQEGFGSEDLKLLEVDESILQEVLDHGVAIRGGFSDEAVLCTSTHTYAIKFVMTSNTVLVMPPPMHDGACNLKQSAESFLDENHPDSIGRASAMAAVTGHLELVEVVPNLEQLKGLLSQRPYREDVDGMDSDESTHGFYTWDDLLEHVQISENELRDGLKTLAAVQIGNFWRVVDEKFMQSVFELILLNAIQHDWSLRALKEDEVLTVLNKDGYSSQIVRHCLATFGQLISMTSESVMIRDELCSVNVDMWELDERHVCLHYAKQLLSAASKWKLDDFLDAWQQNLPSGMQGNLDMLKGEALIEKLGSESWLHPFCVSSLPSNPAERFAAIFRERPKWEWQDLEPYVSDLRAPGKSVEALLLKYTRKTQPTSDASPIFTAR